ncbi:uncharacterized protein DUF3347 [Chitinophaga skermanii]|uniref:Uncharacterized protein DUF3347 n=1 Tax=Chitinophaga skermanii TaxID=331697 RepID=A0A327QLN1_9BACT|nr:DUF3347 domain-containing protein [Chitinophaga skermanii]RAJ05220.1 uncharacterized protein DUF3347 [Chitinophaga skermanii]
MKKIFLALAVFASTATHQLFAQQQKLSSLLNQYYSIKDALVSSNSKLAATQAADFVKAANNAELTGEDAKVFANLKDKLVVAAQEISTAKNIDQQRTSFITLSNEMYTLAKGAHLSETPIYQQYCPMAKAGWLSNNNSIKNPYYGNQMLTCGKVADTIK